MFSPPPAMVYTFVAASYAAEPGPRVDGVPTSPACVNSPSGWSPCAGVSIGSQITATRTRPLANRTVRVMTFRWKWLYGFRVASVGVIVQHLEDDARPVPPPKNHEQP